MKKILLLLCLVLSFTITSCKIKQEVNTLDTEKSEVESSKTDDTIVNLVESETSENDITQQEDTEVDYSIDAKGNLKININKLTTILDINALPDSLVIEDDKQHLLILSDPSEQYQHGILGDVVEASSVTIVQLSEQPLVISKFSVPVDWVIESIQPIWSDWDGDGEREIVLTLSNDSHGAKLVLFDESGNVLAESLPIGKGFRWRHALDIAAFGENGQKLLVEVQTPHIGGIVGFYRWDKDLNALTLEASISGFSTHDIGSCLMHMYGLLIEEQSKRVLLLVPNQSKTELVALRFQTDGIQEEWRMELGGKLSSNIELIDKNGIRSVSFMVDDTKEVMLDIPK